MSDLSILVMRVSQTDEVPGTTNPTGREAGAWYEFYEAIPGAGFAFWARLDGDSYTTLDYLLDSVDPNSEAELDAALAADRAALGL